MSGPTGQDLLRLAVTEPGRAADVATRAVATGTDPEELSYAHHALGIVQRDRGDVDLALVHLRRARQLARRTSDADRVSDVRATLGTALALHGESRAGLREADGAVEMASARGPIRPRALMRRAYVLARLGQHSAAIADLQQAIPKFRRAGDVVWEARALNLRAYARLPRGDLVGAEDDLRQAEALFTRHEAHLEALAVVHNLALIQFFRGDLPGALAAFADLGERYAELGAPHLELALDRATVLLVAGLCDEAAQVVGAAAVWTARRPQERAEVLLMRASARLGQGDPELALADAQVARRLFARQHRDWWRTRADLVGLQARIDLGRGSRRAAVALADSLADDRTEDGVLAALVAGRELADKDPAGASTYLSRAARGRHRGNPLSRSTAWLAHALDLEVQGRPRVLQAVGQGLDALAEHRASLGSPELRALTAIHSADLAALAVRHALPRGPRALVHWSDRGRAASLSEPVAAPSDPVIDALLATIRGLSHRIAEEPDPARIQTLTRERAQKEREVRLAWAATSGSGGLARTTSPEELVSRLGDRILVQLVNVDATLYAVVVRDGRWRTFLIGPLEDAHKAMERALYGLRSATRGRPIDLTPLALRLESALLGPVARLLPVDRSVVVSPPAAFLGAPWGLIPSLHDRAFSPTPSATSWVRAATASPSSTRTVFVAGPGLPTGGGEVVAVAALRPDATTLVGASSTVGSVRSALDGAGLAHIAAHGTFRHESPMFSSLQLADGPLTVDDIHRLERPPHRIVLPACRSGVVADIGGQDVIGFASALLTQGTAGVVASIADVDDAATVQVMLALHAGLASGQRLDEALAGARRSSYGDPVRHATAVLFAAMGAA
ncbi:TPR repeat-containing protein [Nocardioides sp. CF8]|uniref:CHAT domain-containing protein n=1 Tax=Nocardioides sp. CF8 TaxID=110319 RepID=UPI00032D6A66|nr:CHAT domain-containing protein [Nocardioides sp. CF8]EON22648.1 TPR repeat-containing protein [Nocardioides sp. CF8]